MTDRPKTMTLSPNEWRALVATGANNIYSALGQMAATEPPKKDEVAWLHETLDRLKMQVSAWAASGQPPTPMIREISAEAAEEAMQALRENIRENANGTGVVASSPKKKRGWQKGRKRGPRKPKQGEAVQ